MYGIGLPTATRFRAYQNPPVAIIGSVQARKARTRSPRRAIATTPMVRTAAGGRNESLTPAAMPMDRPATASAARGVALAVRGAGADVSGPFCRFPDHMRLESDNRRGFLPGPGPATTPPPPPALTPACPLTPA